MPCVLLKRAYWALLLPLSIAMALPDPLRHVSTFISHLLTHLTFTCIQQNNFYTHLYIKNIHIKHKIVSNQPVSNAVQIQHVNHTVRHVKHYVKINLYLMVMIL